MRWVCCPFFTLTTQLKSISVSSEDLTPRGRPDLFHYSPLTWGLTQEAGLINNLPLPAPSLCPQLAKLLGKPWQE